VGPTPWNNNELMFVVLKILMKYDFLLIVTQNDDFYVTISRLNT